MTLREELTEIYTRNGKLTPTLVVEEAEDEDSPLHDRFEWDDELAGHEYRIVQARQLIRSVRIHVQPENRESPLIRAFMHVPASRAEVDEAEEDDAGSGFQNYMPVEDVAQSPRLKKIALGQMEREWQLLKRRWEAYGEFWNLVRKEARPVKAVKTARSAKATPIKAAKTTTRSRRRTG
jgi:hypothetical protein